MYYPRVTIVSPHLTQIIPLQDHIWQPQKQVQTHLHVTVYSPNSSTAEQLVVASSGDRFLREIIHEEQSSIWNQILGYIYKRANLCKLGNETRTTTTAAAVGGWWWVCYEEKSNGDTAFKLQQRADSNRHICPRICMGPICTGIVHTPPSKHTYLGSYRLYGSRPATWS